jgi:hypothetical protein
MDAVDAGQCYIVDMMGDDWTGLRSSGQRSKLGARIAAVPRAGQPCTPTPEIRWSQAAGVSHPHPPAISYQRDMKKSIPTSLPGLCYSVSGKVSISRTGSSSVRCESWPTTKKFPIVTSRNPMFQASLAPPLIRSYPVLMDSAASELEDGRLRRSPTPSPPTVTLEPSFPGPASTPRPDYLQASSRSCRCHMPRP